MEKMSKKTFWSRLVLYILLGLFIPVGFLIYRFNLFTPTTKLNIGGWGIAVIVFSSVFIVKLAEQASKVLEDGPIRSCVDSFRKIFVPLLAITLCVFAVGEFWKELLQFFIVLTICEPIAYVVNPMPEFVGQLEKEREDKKQESKLLNIFNLFWSSKK